MKKAFLVLSLMMMATTSFAKSKFVDSARLSECGGRVELRESARNLHLKLEGVRNCHKLVVTNLYGEVIETYKIKNRRDRRTVSKSFTLSEDMWRELEDGELTLKAYGRWADDRVSLRVYETRQEPHNPWQCGGHRKARYTGWALTGSCECGFYRKGRFVRHAEGLETFMCLLN